MPFLQDGGSKEENPLYPLHKAMMLRNLYSANKYICIALTRSDVLRNVNSKKAYLGFQPLQYFIYAHHTVLLKVCFNSLTILKHVVRFNYI